MSSRKPKENVLYALHALSKQQAVVQDTHGNVSQRDGDVIWIKPSGMAYNLISFSDICKISIERPQNDSNKRAPSVDTIHHIAIYKKHPWVGAICHTHSPYAVAFAAADRHVYPYTTEQADYFGNTVFVKSYADLNSWGKELSFSEDEKAVLLQNHGALTFGRDAEEAVKLAIALENIAKKNFLIEQMLTSLNQVHPLNFHPNRRLSTEEVDKWHKRYTNEYGQRDDSSSK